MSLDVGSIESEVRGLYNDLEGRINSKEIRYRLLRILERVVRRIAYDIKYMPQSKLNEHTIKKYVYTAYSESRIFEREHRINVIEESSKCITEKILNIMKDNDIKYLEKLLMVISICLNSKEKKLHFCRFLVRR